MRFWFGLVVGIAMAAPVGAQECRQAALIRAMTSYALSPGAALPARDVARATYLQMHYADPAGEEIEVMLDRAAVLGTNGTQLRAIYALSQAGGLAEWRLDAPNVLTRFRAASPALLRALILADGGRSFLTLRSAALADETPAIEAFFAGPRPALYLSDQADWFRLRFASKAEDAGALWLAGAMLAGRDDTEDFDAFFARNRDAFDEDAGALRRRFAPYSRAIRDGLLTENTDGTADALTRENTVREAALATYPISFLGIYHTQSGGREGTYGAAQAVLDAVAAGSHDPLAAPEPYWLLAYDILLKDDDPSEVRRILAGFNIGIGRGWHDQPDALWQLDMIAAKFALLAYVSGEGEIAPTAPDTSTLDWATWVEVAGDLRENALKSGFERSPVATVELLWAQEKYALAWGLARGNGDLVNVGALSLDLAARLDMLCDQHTIVQALDGRWGREQIFTFP